DGYDNDLAIRIYLDARHGLPSGDDGPNRPGHVTLSEYDGTARHYDYRDVGLSAATAYRPRGGSRLSGLLASALPGHISPHAAVIDADMLAAEMKRPPGCDDVGMRLAVVEVSRLSNLEPCFAFSVGHLRSSRLSPCGPRAGRRSGLTHLCGP